MPRLVDADVMAWAVHLILRGGTPHKVNPASPLAGENLRCSISGFFDVRTIASLLEGAAQSS